MSIVKTNKLIELQQYGNQYLNLDRDILKYDVYKVMSRSNRKNMIKSIIKDEAKYKSINKVVNEHGSIGNLMMRDRLRGKLEHCRSSKP